MKQEKAPYTYAGVHLGTFPADVCQGCREAFFTEEGWLHIEALARAKGLWGTGSHVKVGYSGHSLILRIPTRIAEATHLRKGTQVYLQPAGKGKLIVEREAMD